MSELQLNLFGVLGMEIGDAERWYLRLGHSVLIGVDEAGRGPLAGPVHAAAVAIDLSRLDEDWVRLLDDSKKLSESRRTAARVVVESGALAYSVASRTSQDIDDINILQATLRAMEAAVEAVVQELETDEHLVLIDGNHLTAQSYRQRALVKGDGRSYAIAAASILAKTARDELMIEYDGQWPEYGFASNKGYGSLKHREAIEEHGPCSIHRLSFGGVKEYAGKLRID